MGRVFVLLLLLLLLVVWVWLLAAAVDVGNAGVRKICVVDFSTLPAVAEGGRMCEVPKLPGVGMRDMPSRRGMRVVEGSCKRR